MKKTLLTTLVVVMVIIRIQAQATDTIKEDGFAYVPLELIVNIGDTVVFDGVDFHPVLEVSEETWTNNGITPLEGGFDFPSGKGKVQYEEAGVHYYVCTAHVASNGMKGKFTVVAPAALDEISGNGFVSVYPVPLSGSTLYIAFKKQVHKNLSISVYDLAGNLAISSRGSTYNGQYAIDCTRLPKGLFLIKLSSEDGESYIKFMRH